MNIPESLRYTKDHEWVRLEGDTATMGITEFAQSELGEIVFVDLPALGKSIASKETACVVESTKAASDVYSPLAGKVVEVNESLREKPELINSDPYGQGWMIKLSAAKADFEKLMTPDEYKKHLGQ